ncbi:respiratory nitrate reductase, cytochrome c [Flammeovirgaceae bacterium 311]|nr:respiratory nitrate reductase, cytochrome c [Flammeovirgaceae bacterium 311]
MKKIVFSVFMLMLLGSGVYAQSRSGKEIFSANCQTCHSIGKGDVLGPDLAGVTERRDTDWIKNFITNSQKMVAAGDEQAVKVFNEYNKIPMPPHNFKDEELNNLISYLDEAGQEASAPAEQAAAPAETTDSGNVALAESDSSPSVWIMLILGSLGVAVILLSITAFHLFRVLKS